MDTCSTKDSDFETALFVAWQRGERAKGEELVRRKHHRLVQFFRRRVPEHADDLVQRTWLACVESRQRFPEGVPFEVYLFGIARRVWCQHMRRQQQRRPHRSLETPETKSIDSLMVPSSPEDVLLKNGQIKVVCAGLERLPQALGETVTLYYWRGWSVERVARQLAIPTGTVKSRLARARVLLRNAMEERAPSRPRGAMTPGVTRSARYASVAFAGETTVCAQA